MDSLSAFSMGQLTKHNEPMVFDWIKAAQLINEHKPEYAGAGLDGDWECTGGTIYEDGKPVDEPYTYLMSTWATPQLSLDGIFINCYRMASEAPDWDAHTVWPPEALAILNEEPPKALTILNDEPS